MRDGTAKKILTLTVHWHSCQLPTASCKTNFNGKNCHPNSSYLVIDLHSSTLSSQLTSETRTGTQLPAAVAKQTSMEKTVIQTPVILSLICIHPLYLVN